MHLLVIFSSKRQDEKHIKSKSLSPKAQICHEWKRWNEYYEWSRPVFWMCCVHFVTPFCKKRHYVEKKTRNTRMERTVTMASQDDG